MTTTSSDHPIAGTPGDVPAIDALAINTIRTLSMDAVQAANSGHPGTPMALAPVAYALWQHRLNYDPADPIWPDRDRFVLSNGHASMLLYSILHLAGVKAVNPKYEITGDPAVRLEDIERFRQMDSKCPGHPEYRWTSGVETTFCCNFFALFGHDANRMGFVAQGDGLHLFGSCHFKVQRHGQHFLQTLDIGIRDVTAIFAQVRRNSIGPGLLRGPSGTQRIRISTTARIAHSCHVINVYTQPKLTLCRHGLSPPEPPALPCVSPLPWPRLFSSTSQTWP